MVDPSVDENLNAPSGISADESEDGVRPDSNPRAFDEDAAPSELFQQELEQSVLKYEKDFHANHRFLWWAALVGPFVITALVLLVMLAVKGPGPTGNLIIAALSTFFFFGRFVIPSGELTDFMSKEQLFWMLMYMDFMVALFVTFHMGVLFRLPYIGPKIGALAFDGKFILEKQPWMKRMAFGGLVAFVIFPTSTTGSIGGSIFGRLLGLSRHMTLLAITLGSLGGNCLMYVLADQIGKHLADSWVTKVVGLSIIILIIVFIEWRYHSVKKRFDDMQKANAELARQRAEKESAAQAPEG